MIRTILSLGKTPLSRRIIAGLVFFATAIGMSLFRSEGNFLAFDLISNILVAAIALGLLHLRWRTKETRGLTAEKIKDTFS